MKTSEAVRHIMCQKGMKVCQMARMMGKTDRVITDRLSQGNISISKLDEMLRTMDYKIAVIPSEFDIPEGGIEIE